MTDFIPFPNPPGNTGASKTIPLDPGSGFYDGQEIYVRTTGTNPAAGNSPLVKSSATVHVITAPPPGDNDVTELAIPNGQLVTNTSFTVEVVSENYDGSAVTPPELDGVAMTQSQLQYPGTSSDSVQVWSRTVTLTENALNTMTITGGPSPISLNVTHSGDPTSAFVTTAAQAIAALEDSANDEIVFNYTESDLIKNVLNQVNGSWPTAKASYTTIRPGLGSISLPNDTTDGTTNYDVDLPANYLLRIQGAAIGSAFDDGGGGAMVLDQSNAGVWFDQCTFTQKYNSTTYPNAVDVPYSASIAVAPRDHTSYPKTKTSGRDCIFTACTWTNWAYKSVSVRDILIRDCTLIGIRGDFNNNGRVILNNRVLNPCSIWLPGGSDKTHMDMYQASTQTANAANGSIMIGTSIHTDAFAAGYQGQAILLSGSNPNENGIDGLILDTMDFTGNRTDTDQLTQLAQGLTNARLSNINLFGQDISVRRDLASPFAPGPNVYFDDITSAAFKYTPVTGSADVFDTDGTDVASAWGGAINADKQAGESDISVTTATVDNPTPTGATYFGGPVNNTSLIYRSVLSPGSNEGQLDVSVLPAAFADVIRFNVRNANGNTPQMRAYFNNQTDRDAFLAAVTDVTMTIAGFSYSFAASGWSTVTSEVIVCVPTGDAWPTATASGGLWGDGTELEFTITEVASPVSLGSFEFTYVGNAPNDNPRTSVTNVTDGDGVTGLYCNVARDNWGFGAFFGNTLKLGPGYSDSGSSDIDGGIYGSPTFAYTGDASSTKTDEWSDWTAPGTTTEIRVSLTSGGVTTESSWVNMSSLTPNNQTGYMNYAWSSTSLATPVAGDTIKVETQSTPI